jgi:hypothetical protein
LLVLGLLKFAVLVNNKLGLSTADNEHSGLSRTGNRLLCRLRWIANGMRSKGPVTQGRIFLP